MVHEDFLMRSKTDQMPPRMRRLLRSGRRRARLALHTAVLVSLWHAPVPWVHFHDLAGPKVEQLDPLSLHVAEFHAEDLGKGLTALDWHVHLVLPWRLDQRHNCPCGERHVPCPDDHCVVVTAEVAHLQSSLSLGRSSPALFAGSNILPALCTPGLPEIVATATIPSCGWCRQFFETYGRLAAVRNLTGVRLC
jgi:hypothetical protein